MYFPLLFPELPEERNRNVSEQKAHQRSSLSDDHKKLYETRPGPAAPSCRALKSIAMYHSWNFFLLIPYHVERLFIALLEAIPHQLLASSSREESVFQTLPCGGCVGARLLFPAVLKHSFRARSPEMQRSRTADLMLEFRGLEAAEVEHMFCVMLL